MTPETAKKLKNMGEYEDDIPDEIAEVMVRNNLTRGQAAYVIEAKNYFYERKRDGNR